MSLTNCAKLTVPAVIFPVGVLHLRAVSYGVVTGNILKNHITRT